MVAVDGVAMLKALWQKDEPLFQVKSLSPQ
jgi:hypothetical protein